VTDPDIEPVARAIEQWLFDLPHPIEDWSDCKSGAIVALAASPLLRDALASLNEVMDLGMNRDWKTKVRVILDRARKAGVLT